MRLTRSGDPTRGTKVILWIQRYCVVPNGPDKGQTVRLTESQMQTINTFYDDHHGVQASPISGTVAAYLALQHVCGPEALDKAPMPALDIDPFSVWNATGPRLKEVLKREPDSITCPALGTRFPARAA